MLISWTETVTEK